MLWQVSQKAHQLIALIFSAFFWLLSILLVSLLVYVISPLDRYPLVLLPLGVLVQEYFRRLYFRGFAGLCTRLRSVRPPIEFSAEERLGVALGRVLPQLAR